MQQPTLTWTAIAAAWGVLVAGSFGVMKIVDGVRGWVEKHLPKIEPRLPGYTWIGVALGAGVFTCLTSHLNPITTLYPPLAHTYGEVLSGIVLGSIASPLHHGTALLSAKSKAVAAAASATDPAGDAGQSVLDYVDSPDPDPTQGIEQPAPAGA